MPRSKSVMHLVVKEFDVGSNPTAAARRIVFYDRKMEVMPIR